MRTPFLWQQMAPWSMTWGLGLFSYLLSTPMLLQVLTVKIRPPSGLNAKLFVLYWMHSCLFVMMVPHYRHWWWFFVTALRPSGWLSLVVDKCHCWVQNCALYAPLWARLAAKLNWAGCHRTGKLQRIGSHILGFLQIIYANGMTVLTLLPDSMLAIYRVDPPGLRIFVMCKLPSNGNFKCNCCMLQLQSDTALSCRHKSGEPEPPGNSFSAVAPCGLPNFDVLAQLLRRWTSHFTDLSDTRNWRCTASDLPIDPNFRLQTETSFAQRLPDSLEKNDGTISWCWS